jgi:hypothetical protein
MFRQHVGHNVRIDPDSPKFLWLQRKSPEDWLRRITGFAGFISQSGNAG